MDQMLKGLNRTPLNAVHHSLKAKMMDFAGWDLPVWYSSILEEHQAVRSDKGMFDVSDMGRVTVTGKDAKDYLSRMLTRRVSQLEMGASQLCLLCLVNGGILDDLFVYRTGYQSYLIVWNAAEIERKLEWLDNWNYPRSDIQIEDISSDTAMLAVQGPAISKLPILGMASELPRFYSLETEIEGIKVTIARTGYTGEDGFEIICNKADAVPLWQVFLDAGVRPCGLGCRDTLRLEAGMMLSGQDMDETTNPYEAGLGWLVDLNGQDFVGKLELMRIKDQGVSRKLVGFQMNGREIARPGYPVVQDGEEIGKVTSGGPSPTLGKNIGFCYVPSELSKIGNEINISVRNKPAAATVVSKRFYKKGE